MLKYNKAGELIGQFGVGDSQIPHSLALAEDLDLICLADRENMRYSAIYRVSKLKKETSKLFHCSVNK